MLRRELLMGLAGLVATRAAAEGGTGESAPAAEAEPGMQLGAPSSFSRADVTRMARDLAAKSFEAPARIPEAWTNISYDDYRAIWFDHRNALWEPEGELPFRVDFFAPGLYFPTPIEVSVVDGGEARPVLFDMGVFDTSDRFPDLPVDESLGYSGLRLRAELDTPGIFTEFAVFQGASYFRGIGAGQTYGLSARGLAVDTAEPSGEEFPEFRRFWIERPAARDAEIVVHALLDGPSASGAYRFRIRPGERLDIRVEAEIFARTRLRHYGIAPLTSMFQFDETNRHRFSDFRSAVHDSDGLLILNGGGETIWRPLANPAQLQISGFQDNNPRGFGLMQRARGFEDFGDLEAHYHRRPSLWIVPGEEWGPGEVTLVEIPTDDEIYDNIVAYWRPRVPLEPGQSAAFSYDMSWGARGVHGEGLAVINTRSGKDRGGGLRFTIDFAPDPEEPLDLDQLVPLVRASAGEVVAPIVERNPETGGVRLGFKLLPGDAQVIEMRAQLRSEEAGLSEVWLYRWTA
ncbi:glucan biosynthesis protein G [Roseivivax sp. GX 12232]|uniref:glucan biosynthesis protein n=1 Tax=Roseivivax sp. GX 12232 TaxID=2900547 RepID=UPI001E5A4D17|nr:glucan biosynthesis protein G [Roseivivax sp. GX 12232]MCE0506705.1 glucan biosynthesis protein G [Roseivivax sp. GX 12232]